MNITVEEDTDAPTIELHTNVTYKSPLGVEKPLPPGTKVAIAQYMWSPVFMNESPYPLITWKRVEQIIGYGVIKGYDGYLNTTITPEYAPKDRDTIQLRIIADAIGNDEEYTATGRIKGYVQEKADNVMSYYRCLSGMNYFTHAPDSKIYKPLYYSNITINTGNTITIRTEGWATTKGYVNPYAYSYNGKAATFINDNTAFEILEAIIKGYDFVKSVDPELAGKSISSIKCVWDRTGADLSGGYTHIKDVKANNGNYSYSALFVKGEVNGDNDCFDEDIILRAYGEYVLKKLGKTVDDSKVYSWFTRTTGVNSTQEAFQKGFANWFSCAARRDPAITNRDKYGNPIYDINLATGAYTNYQPELSKKIGMRMPSGSFEGISREAIKAAGGQSSARLSDIFSNVKSGDLKGLDNETAVSMQLWSIFNYYGDQWTGTAKGENTSPEPSLIGETKSSGVPSLSGMLVTAINQPDPSSSQHAGLTIHDLWNTMTASLSKGDGAMVTDMQKDAFGEQYVAQGLKPALDSVGNTGGLRPLFSWLDNGILAQVPDFRLEVSEYDDFSYPTTWEVGPNSYLDLSTITDSVALVRALSNSLLPGRYYWRVAVDKNNTLPNLYSPSGAFELYPDGTIVGIDGGTVTLGTTPVYDDSKSTFSSTGAKAGEVVGGQLDIPAGLFDDTTEVMFITQAVSTPDEVGGYKVLGKTLWDISTSPSIPPLEGREGVGSLKLTYDDSLLGGVSESALGIYRWDAAQTVWDYTGGVADPDSNSITATISRAGVYGILVDRRPPFISQVTDGPDPITPLESNNQIAHISYKISEPARINLVIRNSEFVIRNLLVDYPQHSLYNTVTWDGKDSLGSLVPSGRYSYVIYATDFSGQEANPYTGTILVTTGPVAGVTGNTSLYPALLGGNAGVSVIIEGTTLCDTTDSAGYYSLTGLPAGNYNVHFFYPAYFEESRSINLAEGQSGTLPQVTMTNRAASGAAILLSRVTPNGDAADEEQVLSFNSDRKTVFKAEVLDLRGGGADGQWLTKTMFSDTLLPGYNVFRWDCRDEYLRLAPNGAYRIKLSALASGVWVVQDTLDFVVDVGLAQNLAVFPSSFSPNGDEKDDECEFRFWLTNQSLVDLEIWKVEAGQSGLVRSVCNDKQLYSGNNYITWDGRDSSGSVVPDGIYYYKLVPYFITGQKSFELSGQVSIDASAPEIISLTPATGDTFVICNKPTLQAVIKAREGDLALRENLSLNLDGYDVPAVIKRQDDSLYTVTFTPLTSIGNGTHIVIAYALDNTGNEAQPVSHAFEVAVTIPDVTNPIITKLTPADSSVVYNATPSVTAMLFDSLSGIDPETIELVVDGSQIVNQVQTLSIKHPYPEGMIDDAGKDYWTEQWLFTKNYLLYNPHTGYLRYNPSWPYANNTEHYVELRVRDKNGNCATLARTSFHVIIDSIAPQITLQQPVENSASYQRIPKICAYLADSGGAGVDFHSARVLVDGNEIIVPGYSYDATTGKMEFTPEDMLPLDWGQHIVTVDLKDKAGNQALQEYNLFNVLIDTLAPALANIRPADGGILGNGLPYIGFFAHDDGPLTGLTLKAYLDREDTSASDSLVIVPDTITTYYGSKPGFSCHLPLSEPLDPGMHLLKVVASDSAGNTTTLVRNFTVYHDSLPPQISDLYPADGEIIKIAKPVLSAKVEELGSGIESVTLLLDGKAVNELGGSKSDSAYVVTYIPEIPLLNSSEHQMTVKARDLTGLLSFKNITFKVYLDSLAPEVYSVWPANGAVVSDLMPEVKIGLYENPGGSGIDASKVKLTLDNDQIECSVSEGSMTEVSCQPATSLGEGLHNLELTAADRAGNQIDHKWQFTIYSGTVDSARPRVEMLKPGLIAYVNPANPGYKLNIGLNDTLSGILEDSILVCLNGQPVDFSYQTASGQLETSPVILSPGTSNIADISVYDRAFNRTAVMFGFDCKADTNGPAFELVGDSIVYGGYPVLKVMVRDQESGILPENVNAAFDGMAAVIECSELGGSLGLTLKPSQYLNAGQHILSLNCMDQCANQSTASFIFENFIDSMPPFVRDVRPSQYTLFNQKPVFGCSVLDFAGTMNDTGSGPAEVSLLLDGATYDCLYDSSSGGYQYLPADTLSSCQQHIFRFTATDAAGNIALTNKYIFNIRVDSMAPVITNNTPAGDCYTANPAIKFVVEDEANGSGPDSLGITVKLDGSEVPATIGFLPWGGLQAVCQQFDSLGEGLHQVNLTAGDNNGNISTLTWDFNVIYGVQDTVSPVISISLPVENGTGYTGRNNRLEISGSAFDSLSGLETSGIKFTLDDRILNGEISYDWLTGGYRFMAELDQSIRDSLPGQYLLKAEASDRAGNVKVAERAFTVDLDTAKPYLADYWPANGSAITENNPLIWIKAKDWQSGLVTDSMVITLDEIPLGIMAQPSGPYVKYAVQPDWQLAANAVHKARFKVTDKAGNTSIAETDFMVSQDLIAPAIAGVVPGNGTVCYRKNPVISAALSDVGSGIDPDSIWMNLDGRNISCAGAYDPNLMLLSLIVGEDQADSSNHVLNIAVKDYAGNSTTYAGNFTVLIDTTAPTVDSIAPFDGDTVYTGIPSVVSGISDDRHLSSVKLYLDGVETEPQNLMIATQTALLSYKPSVSLSGGWHDIVVLAGDKAGNQVFDTSRIFVSVSGEDTIKPQLAILAPVSNKYVCQEGDSFEIDAVASDTGSGVASGDIVLALDGSPLPFIYQPYSGIISAKAAAKTGMRHAISLEAKDRSGNMSSAEAAGFDLLLDQELPRCELLSLDKNVIQQEYYQFRMRLTDTLSGVDTSAVLICLDGMPLERNISSDYLGRWEASVVNDQPFTDNTTHLITVALRDLAGNMSEIWEKQFTVLMDAVPPVVYDLSPADSSTIYTSIPKVTCRISDQGAGIDTSAIKIYLDNADFSGYSFTPDSGVLSLIWPESLAAETQHSIYIKASDMAGNQTSADAVFTVRLDAEAPVLFNLSLSEGKVLNDPRPVISAEVRDNSGSVNLPVSRVGIMVDGQTVPAVFKPECGQLSYQPLNGLSSGSHQVTYFAGDKAGNSAIQNVTVSVAATADSKPPFISQVIPSDGGIWYAGNSGLKIRATLGDQETGLDTNRLEVKLDGQMTDFESYDRYSGNGVWKTSAAVNTQHKLDIAAYDMAGNKTTYQAVFSLLSDKEPPLVSQPQVTGEDKIVISAKIEDDASGVDQTNVMCSVDGVSVGLSCNDDMIYFAPYNMWKQGSNHLITITASDKAGNKTIKDYALIYNDLLKPILLAGWPSEKDTVFTVKGFDILYKLQDKGSGKGMTNIWLDDQPVVTMLEEGDNGIWQARANISGILNEGSHRLHMTAADANNNLLENHSQFLYLPDSIAPLIADIYPDGLDTIYVGKLKVTARMSDDRSGLETGRVMVTVDEDSYQANLSLVDNYWLMQALSAGGEMLPDGRHTISISAGDRAGNQTLPVTVSFVSLLDQLPPTITNVMPGASAYVDPVPTISASLFDGQSGIDTSGITVRIGENDIGVTLVRNTDNTYSLVGKSERALTAGSYKYVINAKDQAGMSAVYEGNLIISDRLDLADIRLYPNPFGSKVKIDYVLTKRAKAAKLKIYAITGQVIKEINGSVQPGLNAVSWDGRNASGQSVSSGVYFYRMEVVPDSDNQPVITKLGKMVRLK